MTSKKIKICVTEYYSKVFEIEADNGDEAYELIKEKYENEKININTDDNYLGADFTELK